ncbi:MAG: ModD protein [Bilophila wadsworthia]
MSFHISQRFIDELLEEDCPYMDLTVEALGIGREPGLLTCHPKAACVVAGVEVAVRLLESSGCRVACEAASGDRLEAGQVFLRAEGSAGAIHRSLKIAQNVMEYSSGIATRAAGMLESARASIPICSWPLPASISWDQTAFACGGEAGGAIAHRLGLSDSLLVFDQHRVFTGGLDGFAARVSECRKAFPEQKLGAEVATRRKPSCWHARASIPSMRTFYLCGS